MDENTERVTIEMEMVRLRITFDRLPPKPAPRVRIAGPTIEVRPVTVLRRIRRAA